MKDIQYIVRKILWMYFHFDRQIVNNLFIKEGIKLGINCHINSNILTSESYLIELGGNITISDHVSFVTHDNSISKVTDDGYDLYGKIIVGDNCFIGAHTIIMYGVRLADNIIVASGSVVTKSFLDSNVIIGGNPARIIGSWDAFAKKGKDKAMRVSRYSNRKKKFVLLSNLDKLIVR